MTELIINRAVRDGVCVVAVSGEIDASCVHGLESALAGQGRGVAVVADLSLLTFVDSSGLHALFKSAESGALAAIVRAPNSNISRVVDIVGLEKTVRVFDELVEATRYVKERAA